MTTKVESDMIFVKPTSSNSNKINNDKFLTGSIKKYIKNIDEHFENKVATKIDMGNILSLLFTILPNTIAFLYLTDSKLDIIMRVLISLSSFLGLIITFKLKCTKQLKLSQHIVSAATTAIISCILNVFFKYISASYPLMININKLYNTSIGIYIMTSVSYLISVMFVSILNSNQAICKNIKYVKVIITFILAIIVSLFQGAIILLPNNQPK